MSSKTQYKDALKREKQIILDLEKKIVEQEITIKELNDKIFYLNIRNGKSITIENKKWWQFWK